MAGKSKKLLSYLLPITKKVHSKHSGTLEINWINGRKVLDSANANYSYGNLQKTLEYGLTKADLARVKSILVLGMGGGSIIHSLRNRFKSQATITAVEFDPDIIEIAKNEFDLDTVSNLEIVEDNAFQFIQTCTSNFDLTVVDLFIDTKVPDEVYGSKFWEDILRITPKGQILFNAGMNNNHEPALHSLIEQLQFQEIPFQKFYMRQNTLVIISNC